MHRDLKISPLLYPLPVAVIATRNEDGSVNVMTAAWATPIDSDLLGVCLSPDHKTNANFHRTKGFSVSLASVSTIEAVDYFGLVSGFDDPRKLETVGYHAHPGIDSDIPVVEEFPLCIECAFDHEEEDTGMVYGRILAVHAEESCLVDGKFDLELSEAVCYDPAAHAYRRVGPIVAPAYRAGKKYSH